MTRILMLLTCIVVVTVVRVEPSRGGNPAGHVAGPSMVSSVQSELHEMTFDISDGFHGVARPSQQAELPSLVRGTIHTVHVREGQSVRKGAALITLDDRVPRAQLAAATVRANLTGAVRRAEVDFSIAESRLQRVRQVVEQGAGAPFELVEATSVRDKALAALQFQRDSLKAAEAERQLAQAQLDQFTIVAPFDGLVTEIHQKSGAVELSRPLVSVANLTTLEVEMHLPSRMFGSVREGETLSLVARQPVSNTVSASVLSVSPVINSASDTFRCLLQIENSGGRMPAGFSVALDGGAGSNDLNRMAAISD